MRTITTTVLRINPPSSSLPRTELVELRYTAYYPDYAAGEYLSTVDHDGVDAEYLYEDGVGPKMGDFLRHGRIMCAAEETGYYKLPANHFGPPVKKRMEEGECEGPAFELQGPVLVVLTVGGDENVLESLSLVQAQALCKALHLPAPRPLVR